MKHLLHIILLSIVLSCSQQVVRVEALQEGVEVHVDRQGTREKLGVAPWQGAQSEFFRGSDSVTIHFFKDGFKPSSIVIPNIVYSSNISLKADLKKEEAAASFNSAEFSSKERIESIVSNALVAQNLTATGKFDQARTELSKLITAYPSIAVFHDLLGNVFYLQGNTRSALTHYREAEQLSPGKFERINMIKRLEEVVNQ